MRIAWIDEQLAKRGMPRRELASAIGFTESQMSKVMNGTRQLSADEADAIRRFFGYRLPDDPVDTDMSHIEGYIERLDARQRRAVALYLEALAGDGPELNQATD